MVLNFRKYIISGILISISLFPSFGQDLPIYSQKLTNTFIYNPSLVGLGYGSFSYSYRQSFTEIENGKVSNLLSFHTPFAYDKFGIGLNLFQEEVGLFNFMSLSGAYAYHMLISDNTSFSMGVATEYNNLSLDPMAVDVIDESDPLLFNDQIATSNIDFSFGVNFKTKYIEIGAAANRISAALGINSENSQFTRFYNAHARGFIQLEGINSVLEPIANARMLTSGEMLYDGGLFFTTNNLLTLGGSFRNNMQYTATVAVKVKSILVGYSYESFSSDLNQNFGTSSQITLRYNFKDQNYFKNVKNSKNFSTNSLNYRRKTQTKNNSRARSLANSSVSRLNKYKKKNYMKSPNYRMNSSKKLNVKRKKSKTFKRKQKRRRVSNHKRYKKKRRN